MPSVKDSSMSTDRRLASLRAGAGRVPDSVLASYARRLHVSVSVGLTLVQTIDLLSEGENELLSLAFEDVGRQVNRGVTLSHAMGMYPQLFPPFFTGLIRVGEETGGLVEVLARLSDHLEKSSRFQGRVMSALLYPLFLIIFGVGLSLLLAAYVLPAMRPLLESVGVELPWLTRVVLFLTDLVREPVFLGWVALLVAGVVVGWKQFQESGPDSPLRHRVEDWIYALPLIGGLTRKLAAARVLRMLALMLHTGIDLHRGLAIAAEADPHARVARALVGVRKRIAEGSEFSSALEEAELFPPLTRHMVRAGEESGKLAAMTDRTATMLESQAEDAAHTAAQLIEPLALAMTSAMVGLLGVATLLPWVRLLSELG